MNTHTSTQSDKYSLINLLSQRYSEEWVKAELRREFSRKGYVRMPGIFPSSVFTLLKTEIERLERFAQTKDFLMEGYETPRLMHTVGGSRIISESSILWMLYLHYELRSLLQSVICEEIYPCLHLDEFMVANFLLAPGSTHGWHLDDPAYAFVLVFEAPNPDEGGTLEFISDWHEFCEGLKASPEEKVDSLVKLARDANLVRARYHASGDAYLLRANDCLHRVTELKIRGVRRVILNLAYEATPRPSYGHTASLLYNEG